MTSAYFYDRISQPSPPNQIDLYFDYLGDIYPDDAVNKKPTKRHSQGLRHVYGSTDDVNWRQEQDRLLTMRAAKIIALSKKSDQAINSPGQTQIVFLVHGFNVEDSRADYAIARQRVRESYEGPADPIFVNVHWDGFKWTSLDAATAWPSAQASGPLVGYSLRHVLNEIQDDNPNRPVRIVTHSSGAFVIGATLGNPSSALPLLYNENKRKGVIGYNRLYNNVARLHTRPRSNVDLKGQYGVPQLTDLRVAMYAAATPSTTFACRDTDDIKCKGGNDSPQGLLNPNTVLLVSINEHDFGLTKAIIPTTWSIGGNSGLGADHNLYCKLERDLAALYPDGQTQGRLFAFEMRKSGSHLRYGKRKSHSFQEYLIQSESEPYLDYLMNAPKQPAVGLRPCS